MYLYIVNRKFNFSKGSRILRLFLANVSMQKDKFLIRTQSEMLFRFQFWGIKEYFFVLLKILYTIKH